MTERSNNTIVQLQKRASITKKSSVKDDALAFQEKHLNQWKDSNVVNNCFLCSAKFSLTKRKHHCRQCGQVFCSICSAYKLVINGRLKRACLTCYKLEVTNSEEEEDAQFGGLIIDESHSEQGISTPSSSSTITPNKRRESFRMSSGKLLKGGIAASLQLKPASPAKDKAELLQQNGTLPLWVEALLFISEDGEERMVRVFPEDGLSHALETRIIKAAIPSYSSLQHNEMHYMMSIATTSISSGRGSNDMIDFAKETYYYCYVHYSIEELEKQTVRRSFIVVSKWPFPQLGYRLADKLEEGLAWYKQLSAKHGSHLADVITSPDTETNGHDEGTGDDEGIGTGGGWKEYDEEHHEAVYCLSESEESPSLNAGKHEQGSKQLKAEADMAAFVMMTAFSQITEWPPVARPGAMMYLHFLGEMLQYVVPSVQKSLIIGKKHPSSKQSDEKISVNFSDAFAAINLITLLGPLGLVQHCWLLWELLITGQDLIVFGSNPEQCAEMVLGLASLLLPRDDCVTIFPYLHESDPQLDLLSFANRHSTNQKTTQVEESQVKYSNSNTLIVGVTSLDALRKLDSFAVCLFLAPKSHVGDPATDPDATYKGMRKRNAAYTYLTYDPDEEFESTTYLASATGRKGSFSEIVSGNSGKAAGGVYHQSVLNRPSQAYRSYADYYFQIWKERGLCQRSVIIYKTMCSAVPVDKIIIKIKKMHPKDRHILGSQLLRSNLQELTLEYYRDSTLQPIHSMYPIEETLRPSMNMLRTPSKKSMKRDEMTLNGSGNSSSGVRFALSDSVATIDDNTTAITSSHQIDTRHQQENNNIIQKESFLMTMLQHFQVLIINFYEEVIAILTPNRQWLKYNIPTLILWFVYLIIFWCFKLAGCPLVLIIGAAYLTKIPDKAPPTFVAILESIFPDILLFPFGKEGDKQQQQQSRDFMGLQSAASGHNQDRIGVSGGGRVDMSGVWKRVKLENYENFIAAQGASFLQRKLASSIQMVHTITMSDDCSAIRLQEKGGPIDSDNLYTIDGAPIKTKTASSEFNDTIFWEEDKWVMRKVRLPKEEYEILVYRSILEEKRQLLLYSKMVDLKNNNKETIVDTTCYYEYVGPSPNTKPASVAPSPAITNTRSNNIAASLGDENGHILSLEQRADMSGVWKRVKLENYENFIAAQGASFLQRKLASSIQMVHTITMSDDCSAIRLQERGGPINSDILYTVDGPKVHTKTASSDFLDQVYWEGGVWVTRKLRLPSEQYELFVCRKLIDDGKKMELYSKMMDLTGDGKMIVDTTCIYEYQGPSPNDRPASAMQPYVERKLSFSAAINNSTDVPIGSGNEIKPESPAIHSDEGNSSIADCEDISGVWERVKSVNMESVLGATGAGFMARKLGASMALSHTITLNPPLFTAMRLQEKGGPLNSDITLTIGADLVDGVVNGKPVQQQIFWNEDGHLVFRRVLVGKNAELIMTRYLEETEISSADKQLILKTVHRDIRNGNEVEATSWFKYTAASPNIPPEADPSLLPPASDKEEHYEKDVNKKKTPKKRQMSKRDDFEDDDDEADDDNIAVSKMHRSFTSDFENSNERNSSHHGVNQIKDIDPLAVTRPDLNGSWQCNTGLPSDGPGKNHFRIIHIIDINNEQQSFHFKELGGIDNVMEEFTLIIGDLELNITEYQTKTFYCRCYWEGETFVVSKTNKEEGYELLIKRDLESNALNNQQIIRMTTVKISLHTGESTESMSIYHPINK